MAWAANVHNVCGEGNVKHFKYLKSGVQYGFQVPEFWHQASIKQWKHWYVTSRARPWWLR